MAGHYPLMPLAVVLVMGVSGAMAVAAEKTSLSPPVSLPDGQEFTSWEVPPAFSRTYYVNQLHARASDDNPGSEALPFKTIGRAAQLLQPGERVVVAWGWYRERVRPARGGTGPDRMISYEAAPGATVILSGSRDVMAKWVPSQRDGQRGPDGLWMTQLPQDLFPAENPFALVNLTDEQIDKCMPWAVPTKGKVPNTLRRGLVFQGSMRLVQVARYEDSSKAAGSYWVEADGLTIHCRPLGDGDPNRARFEVTAQGQIFAPEACGLGYIRVKGFTIEHAGNCLPRPQEGALSTRRGHHWIIEDNTVRQCNAIGIDIGDLFDDGGPPLAEGGQHVVRRNTITDCGIGGIEGKSIQHTLIERNTIRNCGWQRAQLIYETGGIKVHCTLSCLVRRNLITDSVDAPGIWMDYENVNSRCTANVIVNTRSSFGGIFMEASQRPNLVDDNFVWGTTGNGIYQHDCDDLTIAHNFVGQSTGAGVKMQICQGREVGGRLSTAKRNKVLNNVFVDNGAPLAISDPDNLSDYNVFAGGRSPFDLAEWQKTHGWDQHSVTAEIRARFEPETLILDWSTRDQIPLFPRIDGLSHDFWGRARDERLVWAGPFGVIPRDGRNLRVDPRRP